ncbi:MAG TPA: Cys-tRNA(Pro) deacylase [Herpetosiphonaceae bacterium]
MKKTRAIELLEQAGAAYEIRSFSAEEFTADEAARELGLDPATLFKTLVVRGERHGIALAMVPANAALSLRKLAALMGDKRADMIDLKDLTRLTGYVKGGVSPLGGKRPYPVYLDQSALDHPAICMSAGQRGLQMLLAPADLVALANATVGDLRDA